MLTHGDETTARLGITDISAFLSHTLVLAETEHGARGLLQ